MPTIYYSYNQVWTKKKSSNLKPIEFWITERKHNWNQSSEIYYFENYTSAFICFVLHLFPFGNSKFYLNVQGFTHARTHTHKVFTNSDVNQSNWVCKIYWGESTSYPQIFDVQEFEYSCLIILKLWIFKRESVKKFQRA